jgi:hypothetical protein
MTRRILAPDDELSVSSLWTTVAPARAWKTSDEGNDVYSRPLASRRSALAVRATPVRATLERSV